MFQFMLIETIAVILCWGAFVLKTTFEEV